MTYLLDVNALIALIDRSHVDHEAAHDWFDAEGAANWATCPITENGVIRIVGHPRYPNSLGSPSAVAEILRRLRSLPGHHFWFDDISLVGCDRIDIARVLTSGQLTDTYLLALAQEHGGRLATFDRKLSTTAVSRGRLALRQIGLP